MIIININYRAIAQNLPVFRPDSYKFLQILHDLLAMNIKGFEPLKNWNHLFLIPYPE